MKRSLALVACLAVLHAGPILAQEPPAASDSTETSAPKPEAVTTESGLQYVDLEEGMGPTVQKGDVVEVHYVGWLPGTDRAFDSSHARGRPFRFEVGHGDVIEGWDEGVAGMQVGGKRRLLIPPELGYGKRGAGDAIPPDATLLFEIELVGIR